MRVSDMGWFYNPHYIEALWESAGVHELLTSCGEGDRPPHRMGFIRTDGGGWTTNSGDNGWYVWSIDKEDAQQE
jgi:hypothetical protein